MKKDYITLLILCICLFANGVISFIWYEQPVSTIMYCVVCTTSGFLLGDLCGLFQNKRIMKKLIRKEATKCFMEEANEKRKEKETI